MKSLYYNNKIVEFNTRIIDFEYLPVDPSNGYWVDKDTGVKTYFGLDEDFISNGHIISDPSWINLASELSIPDGITNIDGFVILSNESIETLILPSTLVKIGAYSLENISNLKKMISYSIIPPELGDIHLWLTYTDIQLKVPSEAYDLYINDDLHQTRRWSQLKDNTYVINDLIPGSRIHSGYTHQPTTIVRTGVNNLIIENLLFDNSTNASEPNYGLILLWGCSNVIIRNCRFYNISATKAISINESSNITIYNCDFIDSWRGIEIKQCTDNIRVFSNDFKNIKGHLITPETHCQAVLLSYCSGSNYRIQDNAIENIEGQSAPEDIINTFYCLFDTNGLRIRNNWIRGGGPSNSGGGFLLGDNGGSNMIGEDNILVNPGQYGIAISGGANMTLKNNKVFGQLKSWSNVGLIVVDWTPEISPNGNWEVSDNMVTWTNNNGVQNNFWVYEDYQWPIGWDTNTFGSSEININILPENIIGV